MLFHMILIGGLWLSPFYLTDPTYLLGAIALQTFILAQLRFLGDRCFLTAIEENLTRSRFTYGKGTSMAGFNKLIADALGVKWMIAVNRYIPYAVIIANCYKIYSGAALCAT